MKRSIKPPTKAQQARQDRLREFGCICCHIAGYPGVPAEIHHMNDTGRNISQDHTIPLCPYHHRGVQADFRVYVGPSLADGKRTFVAHWGSEDDLRKLADKEIGHETNN